MVTDFNYFKEKCLFLYKCAHDNFFFNENDFIVPEYKTALKLTILRHFLRPYLNIIRETNYNPINYLDLLCGSGIIGITPKNTNYNDFIIGSGLIPFFEIRDNAKYFDNMYFNDTNEIRTQLLESRIDQLKENIDNQNHLCHRSQIFYSNLNCKEFIDSYTNNISETAHSLIFLDPLGFEVSKNSLEKLFEINCDIFYLFEQNSISRNLRNHNLIENLLGEGNYTSLEELLEGFEEIITGYQEKELIFEKFKIKSYYLYFITKKTAQGNPWLINILSTLNVRLNRLPTDSYRRIFNQLTGRSTTLNEFF